MKTILMSDNCTNLKDCIAMLHAGIDSILNLNPALEEISYAIHMVKNNESYFTYDALHYIVEGIEREPLGNIELKNDEAMLIEHLCEGKSEHDIAVTLNKDKKTILDKYNKIITKIGVTNNVDLMMYAMQKGMDTITQ